jgi:glycosyltransferase involved in cell wall biosynthesis
VRIVLVGNYAPDSQESMRRYTELLRAGLTEAGHRVSVCLPRCVLNASARGPTGLWKWIGYLDKYLLGRPEAGGDGIDLIHVCDHSNAVYVPSGSPIPYVVTCHDLLAVRGALGEDTDCPASFTGRLLQMSIVRGLRRAQALACVSGATLTDARKLLAGYHGKLALVPNAFNYPYRRLEERETLLRLAAVTGLEQGIPYVLTVGSNLRRKNREVVLRALASIHETWRGRIVFAGEPLSRELRAMARELAVADRVIEVPKPSNQLLEALYNGALALLFPSRFEGFGWPIIEAQACGCPVICSDRAPLPEVAGGAAIFGDADDHQRFGSAIASLERDPQARGQLRARGLDNARRYGRPELISRLLALYQELLAA